MTLLSDQKTPTSIPSAETTRLLDPPKFSLRTMLVVVALICGSLALAKIVGPLGVFAALIAICVVSAHVVGNALGTRLRDGGRGGHGRVGKGPPGSESEHHFDAASQPPVVPRGGAQRHHFAPATRLSRRHPIGRLQLAITGLGGLIGAGGGAWLLHWLYPDSVTVSAMVFGGVAVGALFAFWSFWTFSLTHVLLGAWWEAHRHGRARK